MEYPISQQFFALAANQNFRRFGADVKEKNSLSLSPKVPTLILIDNQYYEWYLD